MIHVIKADRRHEPFSELKVMDSIRRARIPQSLQGAVLTHVKTKLYNGISTAEIYQHIMEFLDKAPASYMKARYSLKESIMMLGPSGYPFEDFVSKILESEGYKTQVRQLLAGRCVTHEIDILAEKEGKTMVIEAKFHNSPGTRSEIQVALYTHARYEDVKARNSVHESWIITNTKTTVDANTYAQCTGMKIISWDYPAGNSLREMIERSGLHPITMVASLSPSQKMTLLENHVVLCRDITDHPDLLDMLYLSKFDREKILTEVRGVCAI